MSDIGKTSKRKPFIVRLDDRERKKLERIAKKWNVPLADAIRRLILDKRLRD